MLRFVEVKNKMEIPLFMQCDLQLTVGQWVPACPLKLGDAEKILPL